MSTYLGVRRIYLLAGACVLAGCGGEAPVSERALRAELVAFESRWAAAAVARDGETLDSLMAPEWTITLADGRRSDKMRAIRRWTTPSDSGVVRELSQVDSVEVRQLGPDAAVVTAAITDIEIRATTADTTRTRVTDVVVRRDGRWRAVVSHESVRGATP